MWDRRLNFTVSCLKKPLERFKNIFLDSPLSPSLSPSSRPNRKSSNGGQGAQGAQRGQEGQEGHARGQKLTYTERMEEEHTYTAIRGDRHHLRRFECLKYIERIYEMSSWQIFDGFYTMLRKSQYLRK